MRSSFLAGFVQVQYLPESTQVACGASTSDSPPLVRVTNDLEELREGVLGHCSTCRAARLEGGSPGALGHQDKPEGAHRGALAAACVRDIDKGH
jgi:hypothetical protein